MTDTPDSTDEQPTPIRKRTVIESILEPHRQAPDTPNCEQQSRRAPDSPMRGPYPHRGGTPPLDPPELVELRAIRELLERMVYLLEADSKEVDHGDAS